MRNSEITLNRSLSALIILCLLFTLVFSLGLTTGVQANNTIYYVSPSGNDSNNGTSQSTPWRTLSKVSGFNFSPGDQILFQCGGTWSGQLFIHNSGNSGSPIKFGSYGTGSKPLLNGGGIYSTVWINGVSYITVENLRITNYDGANIFDLAEGSRAGIRLDGTTNTVKLLNNEVYYIEGFSNHPTVGSPRGTTLDPQTNNQYIAGAIYNTGTSTNLLIDGNYVHDTTCQGIMAAGSNYGLIIQNNTVHNVGSDGIQYYATSPLIQYNSVTYAGNNSGTAERGTGVLGYRGLAVAGIWGYNTSNQITQFNYCANTNNIKYDGQAWDFDMQTTGGVYQYNFSRDNEGGFILGSVAGQVARYNISYNDGANCEPSQGFFGGGGVAGDFYNNVFYQNNGAGFLKNITGGNFKNNIFYTNCTNTARTNYKSTTGLTFSNNCFSGGQTALNTGYSPILANPMLSNPTSVGTTIDSVDGMMLQAGSPCINAGTSIPNNGGRDYWGNTLYNGNPDIGAYEYTGTVPTPTPTPTSTPTPPPTGDTHSGTWAAKAIVTGSPTWDNLYQGVSSVATNTNYVGSFWMKGTGKLKLRIYNASWSTLIAEQEFTATSSWAQYTLPAFNTGSNSTLYYVLCDSGNTSGTIYIDDCFLGVSDGTNKLSNAGFESGTTSWSISNPNVYSIIQSTPANENTHSGTWSARANVSGTPTWNTLYQNISSVPTNTSYTASFWMKGTGKMRLRVFTSNWSSIIAEQEFTATSDWTQYTLSSFNTGSNTGLVYVFTDSGNTNGTLYLDDCFIGISGGTNKLTNMGFESGNTIWATGGSGIFTILQP